MDSLTLVDATLRATIDERCAHVRSCVWWARFNTETTHCFDGRLCPVPRNAREARILGIQEYPVRGQIRK